MAAPRLEIDLAKIGHNARALVGALGERGISVTGVTKATLGSPAVARTLRDAGVRALGDSRVANLERMRDAGVPGPLVLLRSPMLSEAARVVRAAEVSLNSEPAVIARLSAEAGRAGVAHGVVLMVELGDLREGILPDDLAAVVRATLDLPHVTLDGIGANLACQSGVAPDAANMAALTALARTTEDIVGLPLPVVSGGNSANLGWALGGDATGAINDLRLGESILLGTEPLHRRPIDDLHTDAVTLVGEVIEAKVKPSLPWGTLAQAAFGAPPPAVDRGHRSRCIVALGQQDTDPGGLHAPAGIDILGASSDHLVLDTETHLLAVGDEVRFTLDYGALVRAMTSPFVAQTLVSDPR